MWFDKLALGQQEQVAKRLTEFKNPEKDPEQTKLFLDATLKYASVFTKDGQYRRLRSHTRQSEHDEITKRLVETHAKNTLYHKQLIILLQLAMQLPALLLMT